MLQTHQDIKVRKNSSNHDRVGSNLNKIKNLLQQALEDLKQTDRLSIATTVSEQIQHPHNLRKISLDSQHQKTEFMLESLIKGYVMIKHSSNTHKPKTKYVYISDDKKYLCWKSLQKNDEKRISLRQINGILRGEDQTIYEIRSKSLNSLQNSLVIRSTVRNLELQAINIEQSIKFQLQLLIAIQNAKNQSKKQTFSN